MSAWAVRYEPSREGSWILAVGPGRLLVVSATLPADRRRAAWDAVATGRPLTEILDRVVGGSLTGAPDFTLVGWDDDASGTVEAHVFARGEMGPTLTTAAGAESVESAGVSTWEECRVEGVTAVAGGTTVSDDAGLPIGHGMVLASGFVASASAAAASAPRPVAPQAEKVAEQTIASPVEAPPESAPTAVEKPPAPSAVEKPPAPADEDGAGSYDHLFGATVIRPIQEAAVRPSGEEDGGDELGDATIAALPDDAPPGDDISEHTVMTKDLDALRARRRSERGAPAAPVAKPSPFLEASDGHRELIDSPLLLGRAPVVTRVAGGAVPRLVKVTTPNQELSRTHVEVKTEGDAVVVTDLHSKNGTLVTAPGKAPQQLRAGEPTTVIPGTVIDLGDGAVFTVGEE